MSVLVWGALGGCGAPGPSEQPSASGQPQVQPKKEAASAPSPAVSTQRVSDRPGNTKGKVFVVEYHHIEDRKGDMFRTPDDFRADLERYYKDGFRPVNVSDYLDDKMPVPPGASPMVFTFDDSIESQYKILPDGKVDPNCAIGIWQEFAAKHPDFPVRATFFVLPDVMWGQKKLVAQKVETLHSLGCELANHTVTHPKLKRLSDEKVEWEFGKAAEDLEKLGEKGPYSLAFPYGISPRNKSLVPSFDFDGRHFENKAAFLVGAEPAPSPEDPKLNKYRIPRIQAVAGPSGTEDWLKQFEAGKIKVYVKP
ncbi:MAG TPA: polysaccharide deacetylase family protein [Fimbriimonas sp.]|nr:polysaccharide deacetylase family protein [Fimbriimonas sp.]